MALTLEKLRQAKAIMDSSPQPDYIVVTDTSVHFVNTEAKLDFNMGIIQKAIKLIDKHSDFDEEMAECLNSNTGYLYKSPKLFVIANYDYEKEDLLVHFVVGDLTELIKLIDFTPKTISFEKNKKTKTYLYKTFIRKACKEL